MKRLGPQTDEHVDMLKQFAMKKIMEQLNMFTQNSSVHLNTRLNGYFI